MYSFEPTEEQAMLIETAGRYARVDLRPKAHEAEESAALPPALVEKGWELGVLQASVPEAYGGFGDHSVVTGILAAEELAWGDLAGALAVMTPGLFAVPLLLAGSEEQKQRYLPQVIEAEWRPYTAAMLEPYYDFDPNEMRASARKDNGAYLLAGEKTFVPYAADAEAMIVYASLEGRTQGFIVPRGTPGVQVGERQKLLGLNSLALYPVRLSDARLPLESRLGGMDGHDFAPILDSARVTMASLAVGLSKAAFDYARDYAKDRDVFGVKVAQKQAIAFMLAEMATEIEASRLVTWEAAWMLDAGKEDASKQAYLSVIGAMDMAMMVTDRALQVLGGHGYIREHPVELWMRNGRGIACLTGLAVV